MAGGGCRRWSARGPGRRAAPGAAGARRAAAGVGAAGERADLDLGVAEQQAQHLASGVPAGAGDRDPLPRHVHDYTDRTHVHVQAGSATRNAGARVGTPRLGSPHGETRLTPTTCATSGPSPRGSATCWPAATPTARVPGCPDWTAADLLWHLARGAVVLGRRRSRTRPARPATSRCRPERPDVVRRAAGGVRRVLRRPGRRARAPPTRPSRPGPGRTSRPSGFTFRRQAHEALIHRLDAEQTAGDGHRRWTPRSPRTACTSAST